jgi:hypothetical protein
MPKLTLKKFREMTENLSENTLLAYHSFDKGLCLTSYRVEDFWLFPKDHPNKTLIVLNPASDYDTRASRKVEEK